ncbi:MAG: 2-hydroxyacid dehydrogenase [Candidatus Hodarchaeales archaeon]|jgi:D-3-phosphoglycerate dehydrogenase
MKILFGINVSPTLKEYYQMHLPKKLELIFPPDTSDETLLELAPEIDVLLAYKISKSFLDKAKKLKHIQVPWTGSEHLDFRLLKEYPDITVSNSHSNSLAIAEHSIALMFAAAKRITYFDSGMRRGDWSPRYNDEKGQWLSEKTLGIIGYGAIGKKVATILKSGFQMKILAIKRHPEQEEADKECDFLGGPEDLAYVLKESDFILISLPLTKETKGLIGETEFLQIRKSAIIVNISRGAIIDEKALFESLKESRIAGAGLDVWYNYPKDRKNPKNVFQNYSFEELNNIVMTPHSAFKLVDREAFFAEDIIKNLISILEGKKPINQLDLDLGY